MQGFTITPFFLQKYENNYLSKKELSVVYLIYVHNGNVIVLHHKNYFL